jgi:hypothetical protein
MVRSRPNASKQGRFYGITHCKTFFRAVFIDSIKLDLLHHGHSALKQGIMVTFTVTACFCVGSRTEIIEILLCRIENFALSVNKPGDRGYKSATPK